MPTYIDIDRLEFEKVKANPDAYIARLNRPYQLKRAYDICKRFDKGGVIVSKVQERARDLGIGLNADVVANAIAANRRVGQ